MAPPATLPQWGTAIAGGDIATPSNSEIASGIVKQGSPAIPQKIPYQWFNWLFTWVCAWIGYLSYFKAWGGTNTNFDSFAANTYALTITGFPANANINQGTQIEWFVGTNDISGAGNDNTGPVNITINGGANLKLVDQNGNLLNGYDLIGGQMVRMTFDNTVNGFYLPGYSTGDAPTFWGGTTDSGGANAYVVTCAGFPLPENAGFQPIKNGTQVLFYPATNNTTASTIKIHNQADGASKSIKQPGGIALTSGMLVANTLASIVWDGGNGYWILTNPTGA